jgi:hypothetical protein
MLICSWNEDEDYFPPDCKNPEAYTKRKLARSSRLEKGRELLKGQDFDWYVLQPLRKLSGD